MKTILVAAFALFSTTCFGQSGQKKTKQATDSLISMDKMMASLDSSNASLNETMRRANAQMDSANKELMKKDIERMSENSINYFSQLSREREAAQKKKMWTYLAMGIFFLVVMIVGLMRKRKAKIN